MVNRSKRKGTAFETAVVDYLVEAGVPAFRLALTGYLDSGDVMLPGWPGVLECKATREIDLAGAVDEAEREAVNAVTPNCAAVVKRRNRGVGDAYVVMPLSRFVKFLAQSSVETMTIPAQTA